MHDAFPEVCEIERFQSAEVTFDVTKGRSPIIAPFDRSYTISYQSYIATMSLSCTVSQILSHISQNVKRSHDPFGGYLSCMDY